MKNVIIATFAALILAAPLTAADPVDELPTTVGDCIRVAEAHGDPGVHPAVGASTWTETPYWQGAYVYVLHSYGVFVGAGPCTQAIPITVGDCVHVAEAHGDPGVHPAVGAGTWTETPYWQGAYAYVLWDYGVFVGKGPCTIA